MKKIIPLLLTLAAVFALCVSVMAEETEQPAPEETLLEADLGSLLIQYGGYPHVSEDAPQFYSTRAVSQWDAAKAALLLGMKNWETQIDLSRYSIPGDKATVSKLFMEVVNENPCLFYVNTSTRWSLTGSGCLAVITPSYNTAYTSADVAAYNAKVAEIVSGVGVSWTPFQKALYLHDYLITHAKYDTSLSHYDAYSLLVNGVGVCQAYTLAYKELLNQVGIENGTVDSEDLKHIWNLVKLNGNWYQVDVTWDDPTNKAMKQDSNAPDLVGRAKHSYFLLSDAAMRDEDHGHDAADWVVSPEDAVCTDTTYEDWFGINVTSPFVPLGNKWYYLDDADDMRFDLYAADDPEAGAGSEVCALELRWYVWGSSSSYYGGYNFSGLCAWRGLLVFNTPTRICSYDPETGDVNILYTPDISEYGYVSGLVMNGDSATYLLTTNPSSLDKYLTQSQTLRPYQNAAAGDYSTCRMDGKLYLHQDAADGNLLVLAKYDKNWQMQKLVIANTQNAELCIELPQDGSTLKIFAPDANGVPRCAAGTYPNTAA